MSETESSEMSRLRWRCRRGMLELDLMLNNFLDKMFSSLDTDQTRLFELLLEYPDQVLFDLLMGNMQASDEQIGSLVKTIRTTCH